MHGAVDAPADVLGERSGRDAVHLITRAEPGHAGTGLDHGAGDVTTGHRVLRPAKSDGEPHGVRLAGHQVLGAAVEPGGMDTDEHLVVADGGARHPQ